ncbi:GMC family oxidoreductase [Phenylobacterium sp.]|uniref:GMC oxidoreductase n=1 Tax=Phenylobacterium sp. TaxID=1871053 RepID=UPI0026366568|nr:GMC family oxidoreductase [Phenylobacterium sp.]
MIADFETDELPAGWDHGVCVVGAGAAGLTLTHELLQRGHRVLLLEGGGQSRWERRSQALNKTELEGRTYAGAHCGRFRGFGGSTSAWAGQVMELDSLDFEPRPWIPGSGWAISKSELDEFYRRAERLEGTDGLADEEAVWQGYGGAKPYLGDDFTISLSRYCPEKKFARVFSHLLQDPRCLIVLHANAVELLVSGSGRRVSGLRVRCLGGKEATATVDTVALCLGGIESSRFLLNQTISPWNVSGLLGRHFQDHVQCFAGDVIGADLTAEDWPFGPWRLRGGAHLSKINLSAEAQRAHRTLNVSGMIEFDDGVYPAMRTGIKLLTGPASAIGLREFVRMVPRAPGAIWHHFRSRSDPRFALPWAKPKLSVYSEQSPLSESRIELSDARDPLGLRRARLTWAISELELHTIRTYVSLVRQAFAAKGLGEIVPDPDLMRDRFADRLVDLFHHCGGTRMSPDPRQGVVDTDLKLHGVENVYVCSSSVFPTSGFTNPTHTIMALAIRLADRLSELAALHRAA